jgi:hypothetical protein
MSEALKIEIKKGTLIYDPSGIAEVDNDKSEDNNNGHDKYEDNNNKYEENICNNNDAKKVNDYDVQLYDFDVIQLSQIK